ncbi:aldehyde dehydrogenase [Mycobacterium intracellulare]|uniref:hypothetical protein n=1 Tax=Mycobacterium intracellulare TaxID=1767 RepID=UPI0001B45867|nr:hypothetical protein [Mycobacterium intracellulare]OBG17180.1 hypothetical protein A5769_15105 [Mycobacterium intracellulare]UGT99324.1 aldehyde dehydrogenase [Mycobacterium intracellulare]UGU08767.1 aldehyde dehydrogenase [Mycobacterium intracellulare subsp. intracellulare]UQB95541.1 aldehyde dehydrogenase [Mycobacterium intracellulare]BCO57893.1 hypothetical protein MINTM005_31370 [Mycobacterium intracellulare]
MQISARGYQQIVHRTADVLGVELPAEYVDEIQHADEVAAAVAEIAATPALTARLHNSVIDAISEGRDYRTDKNVAQLLLAREIAASNISQTARTRAESELRETLIEHSQRILESWSAALSAHTDALTAAAEAGLKIADSASVISKGGDDMRLLHDAQIAVTAWSAARTGFEALATIGGVTLAGPVPLIYTAAPSDEWAPAVEAARAQRRDVSAWDLARHRTALALPTLTEYQGRLATFQADRRQRQHEEEKQRAERLVKAW